MHSAELVRAGKMSRVAVVSPRARARDALVEVAKAGCLELAGNLPPPEGEEAEALRRLKILVTESQEPPSLLRFPPEVASLERRGQVGLLAGEAELKRRIQLAVEHGSFLAWVGWVPSARLEELSERLAETGSDSSSWRARPGSNRPRSSGRPRWNGRFVRSLGPMGLPGTGMWIRPGSPQLPSSSCSG